MSLPARKILVQKPKEERLLSDKALAALPALDSGKWVFQPKFDGCSIIILVGVNVVRIFSREGKECTSMPHIAEHFRINSVPNMCYFGEAYDPNLLFKDISGAFRRHAPQFNLEAWLFDAVTLQEFRAGRSERPYALRIKALKHVADRKFGVIPPITLGTREEVQEQIDNIRAYGYKLELDGMMAKQADGIWIAGDDTEGRTLKLKNKISVDLRCIGLTEGKGKFAGMIGSLRVRFNGKEAEVSGGKMTTKERKFWFSTGHRSNIVDKIIEVHALGITPDGNLREPVYQHIRYDKTEESI